MALLNNAIVKVCRRFPKEIVTGGPVRFHSNKIAIEDMPYIRIDRCPGRETVGFGIDGERDYYDRTDYPCPAVRYKIETPEIKALRVKEKGDWNLLTIDEKKQLYRASFRLTFAEIDAPTGRMKSYFGWACFFWACGIWVYIAFFNARNRGTMRPSLSLESRQAQLQRQIAMRVDPIHGISSKWDYEKDEWKS